MNQTQELNRVFGTNDITMAPIATATGPMSAGMQRMADMSNLLGQRGGALGDFPTNNNGSTDRLGMNADGSPDYYTITAATMTDEQKQQVKKWLEGEIAKNNAAVGPDFTKQQALQKTIRQIAEAGLQLQYSNEDIAAALNGAMKQAGVMDSNFTAESLSQNGKGTINTSFDQDGPINYTATNETASSSSSSSSSSAASAAQAAAQAAAAAVSSSSSSSSSSASSAGDPSSASSQSSAEGGSTVVSDPSVDDGSVVSNAELTGDVDAIAGEVAGGYQIGSNAPAGGSTGTPDGGGNPGTNDPGNAGIQGATVTDGSGVTWTNQGQHPVSGATIWNAVNPPPWMLKEAQAGVGDDTLQNVRIVMPTGQDPSQYGAQGAQAPDPSLTADAEEGLLNGITPNPANTVNTGLLNGVISGVSTIGNV